MTILATLLNASECNLLHTKQMAITFATQLQTQLTCSSITWTLPELYLTIFLISAQMWLSTDTITNNVIMCSTESVSLILAYLLCSLHQK